MPWGEFLKLPAHMAIAMWNQTKKIIEEDNKNQKEQEQSTGMPNVPTSMSGMMSMAKSMAGSSGISMPSGMPNIGSMRMPH